MKRGKNKKKEIEIKFVDSSSEIPLSLLDNGYFPNENF